MPEFHDGLNQPARTQGESKLPPLTLPGLQRTEQAQARADFAAPLPAACVPSVFFPGNSDAQRTDGQSSLPGHAVDAPQWLRAQPPTWQLFDEDADFTLHHGLSLGLEAKPSRHKAALSLPRRSRLDGAPGRFASQSSRQSVKRAVTVPGASVLAFPRPPAPALPLLHAPALPLSSAPALPLSSAPALPLPPLSLSRPESVLVTFRSPARQTLTVFSLVGGSGRTSIAAAIARMLAGSGLRVLLVDTIAHSLLPRLFGSGESRQGVIRNFLPATRDRSRMVSVVSLAIEAFAGDDSEQYRILHEFTQEATRYDRVVWDLGGAPLDWAAKVLSVSPEILVPLLPDTNSLVQLRATERFLHHCHLDGTAPLQWRYVLNNFNENDATACGHARALPAVAWRTITARRPSA